MLNVPSHSWLVAVAATFVYGGCSLAIVFFNKGTHNLSVPCPLSLLPRFTEWCRVGSIANCTSDCLVGGLIFVFSCLFHIWVAVHVDPDVVSRGLWLGGPGLSIEGGMDIPPPVGVASYPSHLALVGVFFRQCVVGYDGLGHHLGAHVHCFATINSSVHARCRILWYARVSRTCVNNDMYISV
jgi:hypothetical protein